MASVVVFVTFALLNVVSCTIYNVTSDDDCCLGISCDDCHNLQHYLPNPMKYLTDGVQLYFLPGIHLLHTNMTMQNVHNLSFIGISANVKCTASLVHITMVNNTNQILLSVIVVKVCLIIILVYQLFC